MADNPYAPHLQDFAAFIAHLVDGTPMSPPPAPGPMGKFNKVADMRTNPTSTTDFSQYEYGYSSPRTPDYGFAPQYQPIQGVADPAQAYRQQVLAMTQHVPVSPQQPGIGAQPMGQYNSWTPQNYQRSNEAPTISTQTSAEAARKAALNATATQLTSAEFRQTLQDLLREGGIY